MNHEFGGEFLQEAEAAVRGGKGFVELGNGWFYDPVDETLVRPYPCI